jgi:hypothetical protein
MTTTIGEMLAKKKYFERDNKKTFFYLYFELPKPFCWDKLHLKRCCKFSLLQSLKYDGTL